MKITKLSDSITPSLEKLATRLEQLPPKAHKEFVQLTPKATGNARRKTKLVGDTIVADYAYAKKLDEGKSRQAPKGMTIPFTVWLQKTLRQIMRK